MSAAQRAEAAMVQLYLSRVREQAGDPEAAHSAEDDLWMRTLLLISKGAERPDLLASIALTSQNVDFPRWYA